VFSLLTLLEAAAGQAVPHLYAAEGAPSPLPVAGSSALEGEPQATASSRGSAAGAGASRGELRRGGEGEEGRGEPAEVGEVRGRRSSRARRAVRWRARGGASGRARSSGAK